MVWVGLEGRVYVYDVVDWMERIGEEGSGEKRRGWIWG